VIPVAKIRRAGTCGAALILLPSLPTVVADSGRFWGEAMAHCHRPRWQAIAAVLSLLLGALPAPAQQGERAPDRTPGRTPWQTQTNSAPPTSSLPATDPGATAPLTLVPPNTTIVPRSAPEVKSPPSAGGAGQVSLAAVLTQDGQNIDQGLVWRVFRDKPGPDGKLKLLSTHREATPTLQLEAGDYIVNVAFGRANLTRRIAVSGERPTQERFVLNAGGLRLIPAVASGEPINEKSVSYDVYSDERDQYGQRTKVMSGVKPGLVIRLNAGIYNVVGTYGDANAITRSDVTVEAGKLTEATLTHAAAKVTFKLVARAGGDAIADTQWNIANAQGEVVKESVGALPTHIFAPGTYTVSARNAGEVFQRTFTLQAGESVQIEVMRR
jgi:hypothetical protein